MFPNLSSSPLLSSHLISPPPQNQTKQPGSYALQFTRCEPATHRLVPARLRFDVPEPGYYGEPSSPHPSPSSSSSSYVDIGSLRVVKQSQLRRRLASTAASAATVAPAVGSAVLTLLLTLLALAMGAVLLLTRPTAGDGQEEEEERRQEECGETRSGAKSKKSDGLAASSSKESKGTQIASTEEEGEGMLLVPPPVDLPSAFLVRPDCSSAAVRGPDHLPVVETACLYAAVAET